MALKSGRVGVRNDQVDAYGRLKLSGTVDVDTLKAKRLDIRDNNGSRYIDANPSNKTTSLYGAVKIGSSETPTNLTVNGDITVEDVNAENLIATDEIEFHDNTGDFGENAKNIINTIAKSSGTATSGQVLTADGNGGSTWADGGGGGSWTFVDTPIASGANSFTATHNGIGIWRGYIAATYKDLNVYLKDVTAGLNCVSSTYYTYTSQGNGGVIFPMISGHTYEMQTANSSGHGQANVFGASTHIYEFRF